MSKSLGNVIDPFELVKKYGTDAVRYFLLREISPFEDGDFTYKKFEDRYNADLAKGLGNLVSRVIALARGVNEIPANPDFFDRKEVDKEYNEIMEKYQFNKALENIWALISKLDRYIDREKPWAKDEEDLRKILGNLYGALTYIAHLLQPFLPQTSEKILLQLKEKNKEPLFPRINS